MKPLEAQQDPAIVAPPLPVAVELTADALMSRPVHTVGPDDSVWQAWSLMLQTRLRHLVVADRGRCVGVVDDRTLFAHWPVGPYGVTATPVRDLVRRRTSCVLPQASARQVAAVMVDDGVDVVPVTTADGTLAGVITGGDLVRAVATFGLSGSGPTALTEAGPGEPR